MTDDEADQLAHNIISTWPSGPRKPIWVRAVRNVEHHVAQTVYRNLALHEERPPTIAAFRAAVTRLEHHEPPAPQPDHDAISRDDYLALLARRSADGNTDATDELAVWGRHLGAGTDPEWTA